MSADTVLEQRRAELTAMVQPQRARMRAHADALMDHVPRLDAPSASGRNLAIAAVVGVAVAATLIRPGATARLAALSRAATLAAPFWVAARLGWQFARPWLTRPPADAATPRSSP